jgi:NDP-sugar pyrophosphorylase family protein
MLPLREDKWALEFSGRPLIQHIVDALCATGIRDFVFVGNRSNIQLLRRATSGLREATCSYAVQEQRSGMAGAVEAASEHVTGPCLIVSSNDVVEPDGYRLVLQAADECEAALLAVRPGRYFPGGYIVTDSCMRVRHIVEKPERGAGIGDLVNVVVHYHREPSRLLDAFARARTSRDDRYEAALELMIGEGAHVRAVPYRGFWGAVKYPPDILRIMEHYLGRLAPYVSPTARVSSRAVLDGAVYLNENVTVLENAVIRGPAWIGSGSIIGNNVLLRGGVQVGAGSLVGFSTEIKHSYIGRDCRFHTNYVGDSIIDDRCSFGSGAVTANLRLDGANVKVPVEGRPVDAGMNKLGVIMGSACRVGINAGLMPGVLVGSGAVVGPHVCLADDLAKGQMAMPSRTHRVEVV